MTIHPRRAVFYTLLLFLLLYVLERTGVTSFGWRPVVGFLFMFFGFLITLYSANNKMPHGIFAGSFVFFSGAVFFFINQGEIFDTGAVFFPAVLLIVAFSFLMLFFLGKDTKLFFYLGLVFASVAFFTMLNKQRFNPIDWLKNILPISGSFAVIFITVLLLAVSITLWEKNKSKSRNAAKAPSEIQNEQSYAEKQSLTTRDE